MRRLGILARRSSSSLQRTISWAGTNHPRTMTSESEEGLLPMRAPLSSLQTSDLGEQTSKADLRKHIKKALACLSESDIADQCQLLAYIYFCNSVLIA